MIMFENYATRSSKFCESGKVAVPIKYTEDGMELLGNAANIGSVLFHTRHISGQHLFALTEPVRFVPKAQVPTEYYQTVTNPSQPDPKEEVVFLYALLDFNADNELGSSMLDCQRKPFADRKERYDAQYSTLEDLTLEQFSK